jgi:hypothetical protein
MRPNECPRWGAGSQANDHRSLWSPNSAFPRVTASGFHPNARAEINIPFYPTINGTERLQETVTFDAQGKLNWRREPVTLVIGPSNDPNLDIAVTVKEVNPECFAATSIKQREFMP